MPLFRLFMIAVFTLLLTGCAGLSKHPGTLSTAAMEEHWAEHQHQIEQITHWKLNGRVAVQSGKQGGTATLIWNQSENHHYHIEFYGILGQGRTQLRSTPKETRLYTAEGPQLVAADAQNLLGVYTGWYLPIDHLFYWIRGLPTPEAPIQKLSLNEDGRLATLQQAGWTVTYESYMSVNGVWLPQRLQLKHLGNSLHPAITVKWISKSWVLQK